jgi:hypothetical protein
MEQNTKVGETQKKKMLQRFLADVESFQRLVGDEVDISQFQLQIARAVITVFAVSAALVEP